MIYFIRIVTISFILSVFQLGAALAEPALFRISDDDTTIYVLGTVHLLNPELRWRTEDIDSALRAADAVYFEADAYQPDQSALQAAVVEHGMLPEGETLSSLMPKQDWDSVAAHSAAMGLPAEVLQPMHPWLAAITLGTVAAADQGLSPTSGVDFSLYFSLNGSGVERRFFESAEEQIRFLSDLPQEVQINFLLESVMNAEVERELISDIIDAWQDGDLDRINELTNGSMRESYPAVYEALILQRNHLWAEEMTGVMATPGTYVVAVGAAHLPGEEGILNLMGQAGFEVTRQ